MKTNASEQVEELYVKEKALPSAQDVERVDLESFSGFAREISREEMSKSVATVSDILAEQNGIQIRQVGGYGGYSSINMRGTSGKQVNIYLDGMLLNSAQSGNAELNLVPTSILQGIEIYPDFTPVKLTGSNLGGAIHLSTLDVYEPLREIRVAQGSFGLEQYGLTVADQLSDWNFLASADYQAADNDYEILHDNGTIYTSDDDYLVPQHNAGFDQSSVLVKVGKNDGLNQKLELLVNWSESDKEVPAIDNNIENEASLRKELLRGHVKVNANYFQWQASHRLYFFDSDELYDDRLGTVGIDAEFVETNESFQGLANIFSIDWLANTTVFNIEYRQENIEQVNLRTNRGAVDNTRDGFYLGAQNDAFLLDDTLIFTAIARWQNIEDKVNADEGEVAGYSVDDIGELSDDYWDGSLGLNYRVSDGWTLKANVGYQTRIPTMQERFGLSGLLVGSPELVAETSKNFDVGAIWETDLVRVQALTFFKKVNDGIVFSFDGSGMGKAKNIALSEIDGVEAEISLSPYAWLNFYLGGTWLNSETLEGEKAEIGKQLPGIYHETYDFSVELDFVDWKLNAAYQYEGELFYNTVNSVWPGSKKSVDLMARYQMDAWYVQLNIDNLLDEQFQDYNRFWGAGRAFYASANVSF